MSIQFEPKNKEKWFLMIFYVPLLDEHAIFLAFVQIFYLMFTYLKIIKIENVVQ